MFDWNDEETQMGKISADFELESFLHFYFWSVGLLETPYPWPGTLGKADRRFAPFQCMQLRCGCA